MTVVTLSPALRLAHALAQHYGHKPNIIEGADGKVAAVYVQVGALDLVLDTPADLEHHTRATIKQPWMIHQWECVHGKKCNHWAERRTSIIIAHRFDLRATVARIDKLIADLHDLPSRSRFR